MLLQHGRDGDRSREVERREVHGEARDVDENPETAPYLRAGVFAAVSAGFRGRCRAGGAQVEPAWARG